MRVIVHFTFGKQTLPKKEKEMPVFHFYTDVQCAFVIPYPWPYGNGGRGGGLINSQCPIVMRSRIRLASSHEGTQGIVLIMKVMSLVDWP